MKKIKNILPAFLALVFLLASLGLSINKMVCLKTGTSKISFSNPQQCCKKNRSAATAIKSNCCDITNGSFHLADFHSVEKSNIPSAYAVTIVHQQITFCAQQLTATSSKLFFADLPPLPHGKELLSLISTYLI